MDKPSTFFPIMRPVTRYLKNNFFLKHIIRVSNKKRKTRKIIKIRTKRTRKDRKTRRNLETERIKEIATQILNKKHIKELANHWKFELIK